MASTEALWRLKQKMMRKKKTKTCVDLFTVYLSGTIGNFHAGSSGEDHWAPMESRR